MVGADGKELVASPEYQWAAMEGPGMIHMLVSRDHRPAFR